MSSNPTALATRASPSLPPMLPSGRILGHMADFREDAPELFARAMAMGDVTRLRVANRTLTAACHPDHAHHVLVSNAAHYSKQTRGYVFLRKVLGNGLLTAEGESWKRHRRIANPSFQAARVASFAPTFRRAAEQMSDRWQAAARAGEALDMAEEMSQLTLRIACETLFSLDISEEADAIGEALAAVLGGFIRSVTNPLLLYLPLPSTRRWYRGIATLDGIVRGIIARRRADGAQREDLLGRLMAARDDETGAGLDDEELRDEVLTMLLAGHETTANALAWTIYRLSQHPEVADRIGEPGYADRALKESMRLHPPAWVMSRRAMAPDRLGDYDVPEGGFVFVSPYAIHRHPRLWADPLRFDPDRFLPERATCPDGSPRPKLAYLPFGAGQRKCIGEAFALLEASVVLETLGPRWRFALQPGWQVRNDASVTLRPRGGLPMRLAARA